MPGYIWCEQQSRDTDFLYETRLAAWSVLLILLRQLEALPADQRPAPAVMATLRAVKDSSTFCEGSSATIIGSYLKTSTGLQQLDLACAHADAKLSIKALKKKYGQKGSEPWPGAGRGDVMKARREAALRGTTVNVDGAMEEEERDGQRGEEERAAEGRAKRTRHAAGAQGGGARS